MNQDDLQRELRDLNYYPRSLARLMGIDEREVLRWTSGEIEVPQYVELIITLLRAERTHWLDPLEERPSAARPAILVNHVGDSIVGFFKEGYWYQCSSIDDANTKIERPRYWMRLPKKPGVPI